VFLCPALEDEEDAGLSAEGGGVLDVQALAALKAQGF
jgi:hypothetical protein